MPGRNRQENSQELCDRGSRELVIIGKPRGIYLCSIHDPVVLVSAQQQPGKMSSIVSDARMAYP